MDKRMPKYLTVADFQECVARWSIDTIRRRIKDAGLPALKDESGRLFFESEAVMDWMKRRLEKVS